MANREQGFGGCSIIPAIEGSSSSSSSAARPSRSLPRPAPGNRRNAGAGQTRQRSTHLRKRWGGAKRPRREEPNDSKGENDLWLVKEKKRKNNKNEREARKKKIRQKPPPRLRFEKRETPLQSGVYRTPRRSSFLRGVRVSREE